MKFVHSCLNHCNSVCRSLLSAKLYCIKSKFAANYKHLSYKYKICQDDWFMDRNLLIAKIKAQFDKDIQNIYYPNSNLAFEKIIVQIMRS